MSIGTMIEILFNLIQRSVWNRRQFMERWLSFQNFIMAFITKHSKFKFSKRLRICNYVRSVGQWISDNCFEEKKANTITLNVLKSREGQYPGNFYYETSHRGIR